MNIQTLIRQLREIERDSGFSLYDMSDKEIMQKLQVKNLRDPIETFNQAIKEHGC